MSPCCRRTPARTGMARSRCRGFRPECRDLVELVVLRRLVDETEAVIQRQFAVHLPVVLQVPLDVVVEEAALDERRLLAVGRKGADGRIRPGERRIERIVRVVSEVQRALERRGAVAAGAEILRLVAVVDVETELERVRVPNLGQADAEVLRAVDVHEPGEALIRRRARLIAARAAVHGAAARGGPARRPGHRPGKDRGHLEGIADEERHADLLKRLVLVVTRVDRNIARERKRDRAERAICDGPP